MSLNTGILGFYKLYEADAADRLDFFSLAPHLVANSSPKKIAGIVGSGVGFGGYGGSGGQASLLDDVVDSSYFALSDGIDRTIAGWFNAVNYTSSPGIISNWANPGGGQVQYLFWHNGLALAFRVRNGLGIDIEVASSVTPPTNAWTFFSIWREDATDTMGIRINSTVDTSNLSTSVISTGTPRFAVGNRNNNGATLNGAVDAVGIWNRILSSDELDELYNSGAGLEPPFDAVGNSLFVLG